VVASVVGCRDLVLGVAGPNVAVALERDAFGVGDSVAVVVTVFGDRDRVESRPSYRLTVSDTGVARLSGSWLVGRRAGRVVVRAESGGHVGEVLAVVE
jgi:hypothetical protein